MNFLSHGFYYLDARDFGLNIRLKNPCFLLGSIRSFSGFCTRFSLIGFSSPEGFRTLFGITILYFAVRFSLTPSMSITLLIFFWIGDAEPRARGSMRLSIGP